MQTGRLFEIIYLLMDKRRMTTSELASKLEVSTRTIRRDIDALSAAGVPLYMTRGKGGGVHLLPQYVLDTSVVSEKEATEVLSGLAALRSTGFSEDKEMHKRFARLFQREVIDWVEIDFSFWSAPVEYKQAFELIKEAIVSRRVLRFSYYDSEGSPSARSVEPMRLVFKESSWYLRAYCLMRKDWRTFKLLRVQWPTIEVLDESFEPRVPPQSIEEATTHQGHKEKLKLLFNRTCEHRVREEFAPDSIKEHEEGKLLVQVEVPLSIRSHYYFLSFGADLEVLEPTSLREWIERQARATYERYQKNSVIEDMPCPLLARMMLSCKQSRRSIMKYTIVELPERHIVGASIRTSNNDPECANKIGALWNSFMQEGMAQSISDPVEVPYTCYGLYYNYDFSEMEYDTMVGSESNSATVPQDMETITIPAGKYAKFSVRGNVVQAVVDAWNDIWAMEELIEQRANTVDFEAYLPSENIDDTAIDIYIALK